jgi:ABC-2 type transport system permease protein
MKAIVFKELKANRKGLSMWMFGMLFMVAIGAAEYGTVVENSESIMSMMDAMPRIVKVIFGMDILPVYTPLGYYVCMYLWYSMVAFAHAIVLGATIISKEERDRTAEFLYTMPYSRKTIISGKIIAAVINVLCMTIFTFYVEIYAFINLTFCLQSSNYSRSFLAFNQNQFFPHLAFYSCNPLKSNQAYSRQASDQCRL